MLIVLPASVSRRVGDERELFTDQDVRWLIIRSQDVRAEGHDLQLADLLQQADVQQEVIGIQQDRLETAARRGDTEVRQQAVDRSADVVEFAFDADIQLVIDRNFSDQHADQYLRLFACRVIPGSP